MHRLSIIIPHYNSPDSLKELLLSIFKADVDGIQVIVVDDNSTEYIDEYKAVQNEYAGRIEFYRNDREKKGAGAARNVALGKADGQFVMFADADDYYLDGWYDAVNPFLSGNYDIVFFNPTSWNITENCKGYRVIGFSKAVLSLANGKPEGELEARYLYTPVWSKLIRRNIIIENNILFDETMHSNDVMFAMKTSYYAKKIIADVTEIYCVTKREGTLTRNLSSEAIKVRLTVLGERNRFLKKNLPRKDYSYLVKNIGFYEKIRKAVNDTPNFRGRREYYRICVKYRMPLIRCAIRYWFGEFKRKYGKPFVYIKHLFIR